MIPTKTATVRQRCLSAKQGGTVTVVVMGKEKPLPTFCLFYKNKAPENRGLLCCGFGWYPPCPDLGICPSQPKEDTEDVEEEEGD